jgi:hypothetical protein
MIFSPYIVSHADYSVGYFTALSSVDNTVLDEW